jgi:two-component system sensor histidine kinase VanS
MDKRYTRLKVKILMLTVVSTLAVLAAGSFLLRVLPILKGFRCAFLWAAQCLFAYDAAGAADLYQSVVLDHQNSWQALGAMLLMLLIFYFSMSTFSRWLEQIGAAVRQVVDETGEPLRLPRELSPVAEDLQAIQRTLRKRENAARESERRRSDLVSFLAHDLKTPLTSVLGYLRLLADKTNLTPEQRSKYTGIALDKAQRLEELISEFFDITRLDLQHMDENQTNIQLSILLEQLADEFYPNFEEKDLHCRTDIAPQLTVQGDPDKLARVFDNVLRNAVSYSSPGGEVDIEAHRSGDWAEVSIRNEGLEIPEQELSNIFQKFYRLDQARSTRTGGAGLGLAIAREIVERHGGSIRAESNGRYTSFLIRLPLALTEA